MSIAKMVILGYPNGRNEFPSWMSKCFIFSVVGWKYTLAVHSAIPVDNENPHKGFCNMYINAEYAKGNQKCTFSALAQNLTTADFCQAFHLPESFSTLHTLSLGIPLVVSLESW